MSSTLPTLWELAGQAEEILIGMIRHKHEETLAQKRAKEAFV